jgi:hypothetical protein
MERPAQTPNSNGNGLILAIGLIVGMGSIVGVLIVISLAELTNRETTLLGTMLTLLSVAIGWGVSHFYAIRDKNGAIEEQREFHQRNLRTYALKAAEKVTNLSKELNRLSSYLQEELQYTGYRNADEELFAKEERIESAIHMLGALRSINDTSLSDWQGVIGEELDEQRQHEEDQAEALTDLADRISALEVGPTINPAASVNTDEIDELKRQVRGLAAEISGTGIRAKPRPSFHQVDTLCPACANPIKYKQRAKENDLKSVQCKSCHANLISTYREATGYVVTQRTNKAESVPCPSCSSPIALMLDEWPSASATTMCEACGNSAKVSRIDGGSSIRVTAFEQTRALEPLTPEIISSVRAALPEQPWPKGVHQVLADRLSLRPTTVQKVIQHLIRSGIFSDQIDGQVCTTEEKLEILRRSGTRL